MTGKIYGREPRVWIFFPNFVKTAIIMEYANHLNEYAPAWSAAQVDQEVARIREAAKRNHNTEVYKLCYSRLSTSRPCRATTR